MKTKSLVIVLIFSIASLCFWGGERCQKVKDADKRDRDIAISVLLGYCYAKMEKSPDEVVNELKKDFPELKWPQSTIAPPVPEEKPTDSENDNNKIKIRIKAYKIEIWIGFCILLLALYPFLKIFRRPK